MYRSIAMMVVTDDESAAETSGEITLERTQSFRDDLSCSICFELLCKPVTLQCGHSFDRFCLSRWLTQGANTCPCCRAPTQLNNVNQLHVDLGGSLPLFLLFHPPIYKLFYYISTVTININTRIHLLLLMLLLLLTTDPPLNSHRQNYREIISGGPRPSQGRTGRGGGSSSC